MWSSTQHTPEMTVIRMCCRYALGHMPLSDCQAYLIDKPLNKKLFFELLHEERVLLLVYQVLSGSLKKAVSSELLQALSDKANRILRRQLILMSVERDVREAFRAKNITHTFLKGPDLNRMLWGGQMMRYSGDLDVLIAPKDIFIANAILAHLKFKPELSEKSLRFHQICSKMTTKKDACYVNQSLGLHIELHWKTYCTEFLIKPNQAMDDITYALYLCLHAAKHGWSRLIWLVDIIALIQVKQLDILQLRALAKSRHITPVIDEVILLAEQWLGIQLVTDALLETLATRNKLLNKRVAWARRPGLDETLRGQLSKRFWMNAFCSNLFRQVQLWGQVAFGTIVMKLVF